MSDAHRAVDAIWKLESARIIAGLTRMVHDVGLAEELAQDALVAALEQWPDAGVPDNPGAWLMAVGKRRAIDHIRRTERLDRRHEQLARELEQPQDSRTEPEQGPEQGAEQDDVLRLMFISCHPVLPGEARAALTLRLLGGLTTAEIARAFLTHEPGIARLIAGAKRVLAEERVPFELPPEAELDQRLSSVLGVIYLIFNEGYAATSGDGLMRPALCHEALRLGRLLAESVPHQAEAHGLVALMELQASRAAARTGPAGEPVRLHEQNRGRWDPLLIRRGFAAMLRARELGGAPGPYVLQAAIAVCHAQARTAEDTDWTRIAALYDALVRLLPTPVVQLNRAVAVGMARGPREGLALADALLTDPTLQDYHLLPGVRGDLLLRLGRYEEARREFRRAASLTGNAAERAFLLRRAETADGTAFAAGATPGDPGGEGEGGSLGDRGFRGDRGSRDEGAGTSGAPTAAVSAFGTATEGEAARGGVFGATLGEAARTFLHREDLDPGTVRSYGQTLRRLCLSLGEDLPLAALTSDDVSRVFATAWGRAAARTWNRHRSAVRSFGAWAALDHLAAGLDRRAEPAPTTEPLAPDLLAALWARPDLPLRERTLWRLLYESAAGVKAVLSLDVEDLDLPDRRARAGATWVTWGHETAELLPRLLAGRARGPVFLADRRPAPARMPARADLCPDTGRGRLSYERAEYLFKQATRSLDPAGEGYTLRRLKPRD
ncbi:site-specific integrase [Streptomyces sp. LX-29]|uniref:DUF6596 domain-containing protein n=1 Tax=Streptomyces sp. LX-29 TaxID=2900152 RepID=UPI00240CFA13|nr:DUF6596 domain-containing protein [Streptomyces sp. LX-29]WFB10660.1 site-specific integrase [Streptomyces sp. LX-29]